MRRQDFHLQVQQLVSLHPFDQPVLVALKLLSPPFRYGGEEFANIFPRKRLESCVPHLEAVRLAIDNYEIALRDRTARPKSRQEGRANRGKVRQQKMVSVTVSIGLAERDEDYNKPEQALR